MLIDEDDALLAGSDISDLLDVMSCPEDERWRANDRIEFRESCGPLEGLMFWLTAASAIGFSE